MSCPTPPLQFCVALLSLSIQNAMPLKEIHIVFIIYSTWVSGKWIEETVFVSTNFSRQKSQTFSVIYLKVLSLLFVVLISDMYSSLCLCVFRKNVHNGWRQFYHATTCIKEGWIRHVHETSSFHPRGDLHFKTYRDVLQKWVGFFQEIPKHGSHFSWKNP